MTQLISSSESFAAHIKGRGDRTHWVPYRIQSMPRIWARSHRSLLVRYVKPPRGGGRRSVLTSIFDWLAPGAELESRYLIAGLPAHLSWRARERLALQFLRRGLASGTFTNARAASIPVVAYLPSTAFFRRHDVASARIADATVPHLAAAVEAGMRWAVHRGQVIGIARILSESVLRTEMTVGRGLAQRGVKLGAVPDIVLEFHDGRRIGTELLSRNYRNQRLSEKLESLGHTVDYVGTSSSVARRFATTNNTACAHF